MMAVADVSIDTSASSQGEKSCKTNSDPSGSCPLWVCRPPPKKKGIGAPLLLWKMEREAKSA